MNSELQDFSRVANNLLHLVRSEELKKLSYKLDKPNLFELVDLGRQEIKHSRFLIQLLDPNSKIDTGPIVLRELVRSALAGVSEDQKGINNIDPFSIELESLSDVIVKAEYKNIDILILSKKLKFVIVIENKVGASESEDQLKKYRDSVEDEFADYRKLFIFLTPDGREPETDDMWLSVSYQEINEVIKQLVNQGRGSELTLFLLKHYSEHLEKYVLNQDKLEALVNKIYAEHKDAIDFIFSKRPDSFAGLADLIIRKIKSRDSLLFLTFIKKHNNSYINYATDQFKKLSRVLSGNMGDGFSVAWQIKIYDGKVYLLLKLGNCEDIEKRRVFRESLLEEVAFNSKSVIKRLPILTLPEENDENFSIEDISEEVVDTFEKHILKHASNYDSYIEKALLRI